MGWNYLATMWRPGVGYILATVALLALFTFRLGTVPPNFSPPEAAARASSVSIKLIVENPVNAPHKVGQYALQKLRHRGLFAMRVVSVGFALAAVWMFYILVSRWHTQRIAILATLLFATSSWTLHTGRLATPNVLLFALLAIVTCGFHIRYAQDRARAWLFASLVVGMSFYVPMMIWFIVLGFIWQAKLIRQSMRHLSNGVRLACLGVLVACVIPLVVALVRRPELWHDLTGLPVHYDNAVTTLKNIGRVPLAFVARMPANPVFWLGRLPILDLFSGVMVIFGVYAYAFKLRLHRTQLLIVILVFGTILVGVSGQLQNLTMLLPFVYLIVAAGVTLMLQQWFTVFPRNPIARNIGLGLIVAAVLAACAYQLLNYFVAWPNNPDTRVVYSIKP